MRGDRIFRIIALIFLCALVYYFSYDQGRRAQKPQVERINQNLIAKERLIERLAVEVGRLKEELAACKENTNQTDEIKTGQESIKDAARVMVRLGSSRILFNQQIVVACLDINRDKKEAALQLNFIQERRILPVLVKVGQSVHFKLGERKYAMILDELRSNNVVLKIIEQSY
ncbi:MAG: hypothetical protein JRD68_15280 [Deltaproteobacteria bacterium]|nr:hypothetical protein [Deltaproteobacteria bacterium]